MLFSTTLDPVEKVTLDDTLKNPLDCVTPDPYGNGSAGSNMEICKVAADVLAFADDVKKTVMLLASSRCPKAFVNSAALLVGVSVPKSRTIYGILFSRSCNGRD